MTYSIDTSALTHLTMERPTGQPQRPNIPDVCRELGMPCFTVLELIRREGWVF